MRKILGFLNNILRTISKVFIVFAVLIVVINLFFHLTSKDRLNVPAATDNLTSERMQIYKTLKDPKYQKTPQGKLTISLYRSTMCGVVGEACTDNPNDADKNFDKSLFGMMTNLIVMPYANPPASGVYYVMDRLNAGGLIPAAYAAEGVGFASLRPLISVWMAFRNVAYLILVIVIILIGFMIMFRVKLNPQTIISVENSLPKIVMALIYITLSFAIAGFLIDLMYVLIASTISLLSSLNIGDLKADSISLLKTQNRYINGGFKEIWPYGDSGNFMAVGGNLVEILPNILKKLLKGIVAYFFTLVLVKGLNHLPESWIGAAKNVNAGAGAGGEVLTFGGQLSAMFGIGNLNMIPVVLLELILLIGIMPFAAGWLLGIIFALTLLFFLFRIFFMLLKAYLNVLLLVIFSPIILLFEAIPGKGTFTWWFKNLVAELMTFPIVVLIALVGYIITAIPVNTGNFGRFPFLYDISPSSFPVVVGMGLILMMPTIVAMVKELMGAKGIPGGGLGSFFGGAASVGGGGLGLVSQLGGLGFGLGQLSAMGLPLPKAIADRLRGVPGHPTATKS